MGSLKSWTKVLTNSTIIINQEQRVQKITVSVDSGTVNLLGSLIFDGMPSENIPLSAGQGFTLSADNFANTIDGTTIDASSGSCKIILQIA
jgi:hypothetical protein